MTATQEQLDDWECEEQRFDRHQKLRDEFDKKNYDEALTMPKKEGSKMLDQEFFDNIRDLTDELHRVNNGKFNVEVKVIEKKIEEPKKYNYWKHHKKPMMLQYLEQNPWIN